MSEEIKDSHMKAEQKTKKSSCPLSKGKGLVIGASAVSLVVGVLLGYFVLAGFLGGSSLGKTVLSESDLNTVVATYNYHGSHSITAREVYESTGSLEAAKDKDGNYRVPSADAILGYARNEVLMAAAKAEGIDVTDEEITEFASKRLGISDINEIVKQSGTDEATVKKMLKTSAITDKLISKATEGKTNSDTKMPEMPKEPEGDNKDEATEAYAEYIKKTVGDAWNAKDNKWADENSDLAKAFTGDLAFDGSKATYNQAMMAYYTMSTRYQSAQAEANQAASEYLNKLFSDASLTLKTVAS